MDPYRNQIFFGGEASESYSTPVQLEKLAYIGYACRDNNVSKQDEKNTEYGTSDGTQRLQKTLAYANKTLHVLENANQKHPKSSDTLRKLLKFCNGDICKAIDLLHDASAAVYECCNSPKLKFSASLKLLKRSAFKRFPDRAIKKPQTRALRRVQPVAISYPTSHQEIHNRQGLVAAPDKSKEWLIQSKATNLKRLARIALEKGESPTQFYDRYCWEGHPKYIGQKDKSKNNIGPTSVGPEYKDRYCDIISKELKHFQDLATLEKIIIFKLSRGYTIDKVNRWFHNDQEELIRRVFKENGKDIKNRMKRLMIGRLAQQCSYAQLISEFGYANKELVDEVLRQNQQDIEDDIRDQLVCRLAAGHSFTLILGTFGYGIYELLRYVITVQENDIARMETEIMMLSKRKAERERQKTNRITYTDFVEDNDNSFFDPELIDRVKHDLGIQSSNIERKLLNDEIEDLMNVQFLAHVGLL